MDTVHPNAWKCPVFLMSQFWSSDGYSPWNETHTNAFTAGYGSGTVANWLQREGMAQPSYLSYPSLMHNSSHIHSTGLTPKPQTTLKKLANLDGSTWHIFSRNIKTYQTFKTPIEHVHTWLNTIHNVEYCKTAEHFQMVFSHVIFFLLSFFQALASHLDQRIHMSEEREKEKEE